MRYILLAANYIPIVYDTCNETIPSLDKHYLAVQPPSKKMVWPVM